MCQQRNLKVLALMMTFFIIASTSIQPKKVEAVVVIDDVAVIAFAGLLMAGMATAGIISAQQTISPSDVSALKDKISAGGETLISGVNSLGTAIKNGADKATVKALASGAVVYGMLQAMQEVLYPSGDVAVISNNYKLFGISGNSACYVSYDETQYNGMPSIYLYKNAGSVSYYGVNNYLGGDCTSIGAISFKILNLSTDVFGDVTGFCISKNVSINGVIVPSEFGFISSSVLTNFLVGSNVYQKSATNIASSASISVPTYLPQTIINNITNYDGTSDVVLGLPDGTTYTGDDLLTVDPTTVPEDPTTPDPTVPSYPDVLSATIAILSALTPISALLDNINLGVGSLSDVIDLGNTAIKDGVGDIVDAITGTTTGVLTNIGSMVQPVTTSIENFFSPPSKDIDWDKLKNIQIFDKFPFSIPADLYFLMTMLASDPVAPKVDFNVDLSFIGASNSAYSYDLSQFDNFAQILRNFELLAFVLFMLYTTKNLIWK